MTIRSVFQAGVLAAGIVAVTTAAALAFVPFNIAVIHNAPVYANRTIEAYVVNRIYKGDTVKVTQVKVSWCYVQADGADGWVQCKNLAPFT